MHPQQVGATPVDLLNYHSQAAMHTRIVGATLIRSQQRPTKALHQRPTKAPHQRPIKALRQRPTLGQSTSTPSSKDLLRQINRRTRLLLRPRLRRLTPSRASGCVGMESTTTLSCEVTMLLCYDDVTPIEWVAQCLLARVGVLEFAPKRHFALRCESRWRGAKCVDWTARELILDSVTQLPPLTSA
jgi:hypothetical protein